MRAPGAAPGGAAPARVKLSWKRLLRDAFASAADGDGAKLKRLRKRCCQAAEAQYEAAGQQPPDRRARRDASPAPMQRRAAVFPSR